MTMDVSIREISCNEAASHQSQLDQKQQKSSFGEDTHACCVVDFRGGLSRRSILGHFSDRSRFECLSGIRIVRHLSPLKQHLPTAFSSNA